jgi:hypothetical protein
MVGIAPMLFDQDQPGRASDGELNFLPPAELSMPLWRSLFGNLRHSLFPKRLPPLQLTSRPMAVGMLLGDILNLPWYRTILKNLGDVISPETLPPLQLESQPVEVELISDQAAWWGSLLRNLADAAAPERLPALHLTSIPADPKMASEVLVTPRWSLVIPNPVNPSPIILRPKNVGPDSWSPRPARPMPVAAPQRTILVHLPPLDPPVENEDERKLVLQLRRSIRRYRMREIVWISAIVGEVALLVVVRLLPH